MRKLVVLVAVIGLATFLGCDQITKIANDAANQANTAAKDTEAHYEKDDAPAAKDPKPATTEAAKPAPKTTGKPDFDGLYLEVLVDGKKTKNSGKRDMGDLIWTVDACSTTPSIQFTFDEAHMGALKATDVVINPIKDGKVDHTDIWQSNKARAMKAGVAAKLDDFNHIAGGKLVKATALPPGDYSFKVQVNGTKTWDRQAVRVTVK